METEKLVKKVKEIKMSKEMQERMIEKCYIGTEEKTMRKNAENHIFKRPMVAVASIALCLCLTGVTALATTGKLQGFFRDIKGWNGAITGTAYEHATEEIAVAVEAGENELVVTLAMVNPQMAPYNTIEVLAVKDYEIVDLNGKVIVRGESTEYVQVAEGRASVVLPLDGVIGGEYKLVISALTGSAKAEQPLVISGNWVCEFTR